MNIKVFFYTLVVLSFLCSKGANAQYYWVEPLNITRGTEFDSLVLSVSRLRIGPAGQIAGVDRSGTMPMVRQPDGEAMPLANPSRELASAIAINASGDSCGNSFMIWANFSAGKQKTYGLYWQNGSTTRELILPLSGHLFSSALDISNQSVVVGYSLPAWQHGAVSTQTRAIYWTPQLRTRALPSFAGAVGTAAVDINNRGAILGFQRTSNATTFPIIWQNISSPPEQIINVSQWPRGGSPTQMNDRQEVVGGFLIQISPTSYASAPFFWSRLTGLIPIRLDNKDPIRGHASGINNVGEVVGEFRLAGSSNISAFIWTRKWGMQKVTDLVHPQNPYGWSLSSADSIDEQGNIIGRGTYVDPETGETVSSDYIAYRMK